MQAQSLNASAVSDAANTLEQALRHAIDNHRAGRREAAETMYAAVLRAAPALPDANHNLGVLYVETNRTAESLPLFLAAIEGDPTIPEYWLSYIQALIGANQASEAVDVIAVARKHGLDGKQVDALQSTALAAARKTAARS